MIAYFLLFTLLGFFIGKFLSKDKSVILIIVISIFWGISSAPIWGLVSLGELFLGLYIATL